ncbi:MAG: pirin family protein [Clostridiales Family XIII bacterium]|nr:pirin family protein [Clostridiales Family XIII bacterium]
MLHYIDHKKMGRGVHDWLDSHFHFSFAEYFNPLNINFGALRVINDDLVKPGKGFGAHPHENMEIISYVVDGELTHGDSMGNRHTLTRGQVQYMSAGTGVTHSEFNLGNDTLRFLQVWILPDGRGYQPNYGDYRFEFGQREGKWLPIATWTENTESAAPIKIHQDVNVFATYIKAGGTGRFSVAEGRQAYMALIEGGAGVNGIKLAARDALEIAEEDVEIRASSDAHIFLVEMGKENH